MPSYSEKQRKFMGAELSRKRSGEKTKTSMSESQLEEFASKPIQKSLPERIDKFVAKSRAPKEDKKILNLRQQSIMGKREKAEQEYWKRVAASAAKFHRHFK